MLALITPIMLALITPIMLALITPVKAATCPCGATQPPSAATASPHSASVGWQCRLQAGAAAHPACWGHAGSRCSLSAAWHAAPVRQCTAVPLAGARRSARQLPPGSAHSLKLAPTSPQRNRLSGNRDARQVTACCRFWLSTVPHAAVPERAARHPITLLPLFVLLLILELAGQRMLGG